ncbi:MFS transporter [Streptomyces sp. H10-C2]|uniref:MFS transporter n=1 Tax=unclassified Streptomyces TaxID=2593676 RepID=UPI0024BA3A2B|nr:MULTISPECIES: MFS transporter [unclassified Streptomyces]MDJ0341444.1 MFS transporter [Streptomyces sp. PH10-H1]MDJ0369101.1 MFS transporter [Streptomyces sp. H10-C2]
MGRSATTPPPAPPKRGGLWSANFRLYFTARSIAMLGDSMLPVAMAAGLLQYGYGAGAIGLVMASFMGCFAGLVIFGGVIADRFNARLLMIGADVVRLGMMSLLAALFFADHVVLWQVCAISAVNGVAAAMFQPGVASTVPRVASDVQGANGVVRTAESMMALAGPALAGLLVAFASPGGVITANAATFGVSAVCLFLLRLPPVAHEGAGPRASTFRADLVEGWREFSGRPWMWSVIVIWMVFMVTVMGPVTPLSAGEILPAHGPKAYGLVSSCLGAGTALGALLAMRFRSRYPLRAGAAALFGSALYPASVGAHLPIPAICGCIFVAGASWAYWGVNWATSVQTQVPGEILNRIHAYEVAGSVAMMPVGQALSGPAASAFGARHVLLAGGVMSVLVCVTLLSVPAIRNLRRVAVPAEKTG